MLGLCLLRRIFGILAIGEFLTWAEAANETQENVSKFFFLENFFRKIFDSYFSKTNAREQNVENSASCGVNYTGSYGYDDTECPCGKYRQGRCKTGVVIPIWTSEFIDHYIQYWADNVAFNRTFENRTADNPVSLDSHENMYYIGDIEQLAPSVFECIHKCELGGRERESCECSCGLNEQKVEIIKAEGVTFKGLLSVSETAMRGFIYVMVLIYFFVGVSIVADKFMDSIEVITSQEKEVTISQPGEEPKTTTVRIWNETVSNLTLMALGSSAPEILLAVVETFGNGMMAGDLGPSTIVGSASFNLFMIIALCMYVIPDGQSRKIKHLRVFGVTATWSVLAYVWLYVIVVGNTPGVVEPWEALLTLLFFPLLTLWAWIADKRLLVYDLVHKNYLFDKKKNVIRETESSRRVKVFT